MPTQPDIQSRKTPVANANDYLMNQLGQQKPPEIPVAGYSSLFDLNHTQTNPNAHSQQKQYNANRNIPLNAGGPKTMQKGGNQKSKQREFLKNTYGAAVGMVPKTKKNSQVEDSVADFIIPKSGRNANIHQTTKSPHRMQEFIN